MIKALKAGGMAGLVLFLYKNCVDPVINDPALEQDFRILAETSGEVAYDSLIGVGEVTATVGHSAVRGVMSHPDYVFVISGAIAFVVGIRYLVAKQ